MNISDSQRYLLAFLLAPLGCSLLFVFYPKLILPVFLVTFIFTVFLGLPISFVLRAYDKINLKTVLLTSFLIGFIPCYLMFLPNGIDKATVDGVVTAIDGRVTFDGYLLSIKPALITGFIGGFAGSIWYLVAPKPNKVKNENAASGTDAQKDARPF